MKLARLGSLAMSAAFMVTSCSADDLTVRIRATLSAAETAAEAREIGFFRDFVGTRYQDSRGNDREQLLNLLRGYFITHQKIEVVSRIDAVRLEGTGAAHVVVHADLAGQRAGESLLGARDGDLYRIELELFDDGGEWRMIGAKWARATGEW